MRRILTEKLRAQISNPPITDSIQKPPDRSCQAGTRAGDAVSEKVSVSAQNAQDGHDVPFAARTRWFDLRVEALSNALNGIVAKASSAPGDGACGTHALLLCKRAALPEVRTAPPQVPWPAAAWKIAR